MTTKTKAYIAWLAICIIWGTTYLVIRIGVQEMPPFLFSGFRWLIAGPIFLTVLKLRGVPLPTKKDLLPIAITGILLIGLGNGLITFAEQWIPSGLTALLITTIPMLVVLIETLILKKVAFNKTIALGTIVGFGGIIIIFGNNIFLLFEKEYLIGIIAIYSGVIAWSMGTVYSKYIKVNVHPLANAATQMLIGGVFQIIVGLSTGEAERFAFTQNGVMAFIYLAIFGSLIAYGSYIYAIEHLPISFVTTYAYVNPVIALFAGWFILDEILSADIILAAAIILIGVWLINMGNRKKPVA
ncbi:MAG: EamA family transporter [Melioribacteraceae bacterium]|nr:EamA family transporter [Melioribacteraceae bacterium]